MCEPHYCRNTSAGWLCFWGVVRIQHSYNSTFPELGVGQCEIVGWASGKGQVWLPAAPQGFVALPSGAFLSLSTRQDRTQTQANITNEDWEWLLNTSFWYLRGEIESYKIRGTIFKSNSLKSSKVLVCNSSEQLGIKYEALFIQKWRYNHIINWGLWEVYW